MKTGKRKKWKLILFIILGIWLVCGVYNIVEKKVILPFLLDRDNYDPYMDEEACRELVKVENCLNAFFRDYTYDKSLDEYLYGSFLPDAEPEFIREVKYVANELINYNYYNARNSPNITYKEAKEWQNVISTYQEWYKNLRPKLEYFLYRKCNSSILHKNNDFGRYKLIEITDRPVYDRAAEEKIMQYFDKLNAPTIDYVELINDDNANYQIWEISKESDPDRVFDTKITVLFDHKNKRSHIRLYRPRK
ncbi:hypothetical protein AALK14_13535 [Butyricimonas hominis]|uniref:hypothetical protein n=1 Tax=Butyricimonas TaxID=574697 RepID=UPI0035124E16